MPIKNPNATVDEVYEELVKAAGLYGKAFFMHRTTPEEKKKLNSLWKLALRTVSLREEKKRDMLAKVMGKEKNVLPESSISTNTDEQGMEGAE